MNGDVLVSVIIPFLNEERFLAEAIESVLIQSWKHWQLILVNDGSSDQSVSIAESFRKKYPEKIEILAHERTENKGLSASRNLGIKYAKGSLIAFLDADDVWLPEKLSKQVGIFGRYHSVSMVMESSFYWYSWNSTSDPRDKTIAIGAKKDEPLSPPEVMYQVYPLSKGAAPCPSGIMIKKTVLEKFGGFEEHFRGGLQLYEDQALLHKIYLHEVCFVSSGCNNKYRQRNGSLVGKFGRGKSYHEARKYFLHWLQGYMSENNLAESPVRKLVNKALIPYRYPFFYSALRLTGLVETH